MSNFFTDPILNILDSSGESMSNQNKIFAFSNWNLLNILDGKIIATASDIIPTDLLTH